MNETIQSPYEILGLSLQPSLESVKRQYKSLIRQFPPEQHPEKFNDIRTAYDEVKMGLFAERRHFPLYKKAVTLNDSQAGDEPATPQYDKLLSVFETPFNTHFELEKLLDSITI